MWGVFIPLLVPEALSCCLYFYLWGFLTSALASARMQKNPRKFRLWSWVSWWAIFVLCFIAVQLGTSDFTVLCLSVLT